jgi:hypothetical protein
MEIEGLKEGKGDEIILKSREQLAAMTYGTSKKIANKRVQAKMARHICKRMIQIQPPRDRRVRGAHSLRAPSDSIVDSYQRT